MAPLLRFGFIMPRREHVRADAPPHPMFFADKPMAPSNVDVSVRLLADWTQPKITITRHLLLLFHFVPAARIVLARSASLLPARCFGPYAATPTTGSLPTAAVLSDGKFFAIDFDHDNFAAFVLGFILKVPRMAIDLLRSLYRFFFRFRSHLDELVMFRRNRANERGSEIL